MLAAEKHNREVVKFYMHISSCMFCLLICSFGWVSSLLRVFLSFHSHRHILSFVRPLFYHSIALFNSKYYSFSLHISTWYLKIVILHYGHIHILARPGIGMAADAYLYTLNTCTYVKCTLTHPLFPPTFLSIRSLTLAFTLLLFKKYEPLKFSEKLMITEKTL